MGRPPRYFALETIVAFSAKYRGGQTWRALFAVIDECLVAAADVVRTEGQCCVSHFNFRK
jgi:hypothetical protein